MKEFIIASLLISCVIAQRRQQHLQQQQQQVQQQQQQVQQQQQPIQQVPPFLIGESQDVIREFERLLASGAQRTDSEMERLIESWIGQRSPKVQKSFREFKQQALNALRQAELQHQAAIKKLSPDARNADAKLSSIAKDAALTPLQKQAQIDTIIKSLPENVKQELQRAMQG